MILPASSNMRHFLSGISANNCRFFNMITRVWCLNHFHVSRNDGHVVNIGAFLKEDQIAWLVLGKGDVLALAVVVLGRSNAGNFLVSSVVHRVLSQTAAVKADGVSSLLDSF